ncbi:MAG: hypothetical protein LQ352_003812 [Teloschistes flavicans]|nr:MAG: hypothetical protein LQ352_003812 [Teloschistes flavicans]
MSNKYVVMFGGERKARNNYTGRVNVTSEQQEDKQWQRYSTSPYLPSSPRPVQEYVRSASPVTSFLSQIPLGNHDEWQGRTPVERGREDKDRKEYGTYKALYGERSQHYLANSRPSYAARASSRSQTLTSPTLRVSQHPEHNETSKSLHIQRHQIFPHKVSMDPHSSSMKPQDNARPSLQVTNSHNIELANKVIYVDVSTQTDPMEPPSKISSSRLAILQEEEAVAQFKHDAGLARRKEALALEWKHEHKMLDLRQRYETTHKAPAVVGTAVVAPIMDRGKVDVEVTRGKGTRHEIIVPKREVTIKGLAEQNANAGKSSDAIKTSMAISNGPTRNELSQRGGSSQHINEKGSSHGAKGQTKASAPRLVSATPGTASPRKITAGLPSKLEEQLSVLDRQTGIQTESHQPRGVGTMHGKKSDSDQATKGSSAQPKSSGSSSLRIKTSPAPGHGARNETHPDPARWPAAKHLTCYFWYHGKCHKNAAECSYAHHDTGTVAMNPDQIRKRKRDQADLFEDDRYRPGDGYHR